MLTHRVAAGLVIIVLTACSSGDVSPTSAPTSDPSDPQAWPSPMEISLDHERWPSDKPDRSSAPRWVVVPPGVMSRREAIKRAFEAMRFPAHPRRIVTRFGYYTIPTVIWDGGGQVGRNETSNSMDEQGDTGFPAWRIDMFGVFEAFRRGCVDEWRIVIRARTGSVLESSTGGSSVECPR